MEQRIRQKNGTKKKKKMVAHLCLVQRIGEDERITSCSNQIGLLGREGKRTVRVWDVGDNGLRSSQDGRVRVVHSNDETLVRLFVMTKREKKKKGGEHYEQELVNCRRGTIIAGPHNNILRLGDLFMQL